MTIGSGPFTETPALPAFNDQAIPLDRRAAGSPLDADVTKAVKSSVVASGTVNGAAADRSTTVVLDIPTNYLILYRAAAATCTDLQWPVLAAIGKMASDHGQSTLPGVHSGANPDGAKGPMQFLQRTFDAVAARHPLPAGGATPPSAYNPHDAVYTAAAYLCDNGARNNQDLTGAIYAYNPSRAYVNKVLRTADAYGRTDPTAQTPPAAAPAPSAPANPPAPPTTSNTVGRGVAAVAFARAQLGKPYVWGGNGNPGFDCSGLTKAAYAAVGIALPRTAQTQYNHGPRLPASAALQPGDLLFFGTPRNIHHVGMSLGGTLMINSPTFGQTVRIQDYRNFRNYAGAARPAN
ncbi:MAG: C40 family peptidase [Actinomycetota bacterium]|nr:C40 family peptidase [Actinomycetota bacterium]